MRKALPFLLLLLPTVARAQLQEINPPIVSQTIAAGVISPVRQDGTPAPTLDTGSAAAATAAAAAMQAATLSAIKLSYTQSTATSGTVSMGSNIGVLFFNTTALIPVITVQLPPAPFDGQVARISFKTGVTLLTVKDSTGTTTISSGLALAALRMTLFQYENGVWQGIGS